MWCKCGETGDQANIPYPKQERVWQEELYTLSDVFDA